jgi:hypothetical protein
MAVEMHVVRECRVSPRQSLRGLAKPGPDRALLCRIGVRQQSDDGVEHGTHWGLCGRLCLNQIPNKRDHPRTTIGIVHQQGPWIGQKLSHLLLRQDHRIGAGGLEKEPRRSQRGRG